MRKLFILFVELIKYRNKSAIYLLQCNSRILLFSKYACILILILFYYQNCSNPQVNQTSILSKETANTKLPTNLFIDKVFLKNGQILENVKATKVSDSLVVTDKTGNTNVFSKKDVSRIEQQISANLNQSAKVESNPTLTYTWSDYQGNRKWKDAKSKCESIGMRLPTISELKDAYDAKLTKSWKESGFFSGSYYWSSTGTRDHYYFFDTRFGGTYNGLYGDYNNEDDLRNEYHFVRCIL